MQAHSAARGLPQAEGRHYFYERRLAEARLVHGRSELCPAEVRLFVERRLQWEGKHPQCLRVSGMSRGMGVEAAIIRVCGLSSPLSCLRYRSPFCSVSAEAWLDLTFPLLPVDSGVQQASSSRAS